MHACSGMNAKKNRSGQGIQIRNNGSAIGAKSIIPISIAAVLGRRSGGFLTLGRTVGVHGIRSVRRSGERYGAGETSLAGTGSTSALTIRSDWILGCLPTDRKGKRPPQAERITREKDLESLNLLSALMSFFSLTLQTVSSSLKDSPSISSIDFRIPSDSR